MCQEQQPVPALEWSLNWLNIVKLQADGVIKTPFDMNMMPNTLQLLRVIIALFLQKQKS